MLTSAEQKLAALNALLAKAETGLVVLHTLDAHHTIAVPAGMASLFTSIAITVSNYRGGGGCRVSWGYQHPAGGSNGVNIGQVGYDEEDKRWFFRVDAGGYTGIVNTETGEIYEYVRPVPQWSVDNTAE